MNVVEAIYKSYEQRRGFPHRPHLGGSQIGNKCERALWYGFRWASSGLFDGRMLRLFDTGQREEVRLIEELRRIGAEVWEVDESSGKQFNYQRFGGHFALSLDGICRNLPEAEGPHTLEFKTMNDKTFKTLVLNGVAATKPVYWAQVHVGMFLSEIPNCLFLAVNKNTDEIYFEFIPLDDHFAQDLVAKAGRVIFNQHPAPRIAESEDWFECKFCDHKEVCHRGTIPAPNCRTCVHSTVQSDGTWHCAFRNMQLDFAQQQLGCEKHVTHPVMVNMEIHDAGEDWIEYVNEDGEIVRNQNREWAF